jgi:hypothetical protein
MSEFLRKKGAVVVVMYDSLWFMVFNATFNNISDISWRSVLLVEESRVPGENHHPKHAINFQNFE